MYSGFIAYRLPNGRKLHVLQQSAWCPCCDRFVVAEDLPSIECLEEQVAAYRCGDPETLRKWKLLSNESIEVHVAELLHRIEWRRNRRSEARCLECGTIGPLPVPLEGEFLHPQTAERVIVETMGFVDVATWIAELSPEGELVANHDETTNNAVRELFSEAAQRLEFHCGFEGQDLLNEIVDLVSANFPVETVSCHDSWDERIVRLSVCGEKIHFIYDITNGNFYYPADRSGFSVAWHIADLLERHFSIRG